MNRQATISRQSQKGVATIEMAIAVPVMAVMMLLTAEVTRVMYQYNTLTKSVRDGSRYMALHALNGKSQLGVQNEDLAVARNLVLSGKPDGGAPLLAGFSEEDITITVDTLGSGGTSRYYVNVAANYTYVPLFASLEGMGFLSNDFGFNFDLSALSSMRAQ